MRKIFLFLLTIAVVNSFATLNISIENGDRKSFYVGEKAFVSVYIQETDALLAAGGSSGYGLDGYVLVNSSKNASWLKPEGRPEYADGIQLNTEDPSNHWQNNQAFWLQLSGIATKAGTYSGTLTVRKGIESASLNYSFEVLDYPVNTPVIVSYDSAASYDRQIDFHSYIRNNSTYKRMLVRPYMDYYMTKTTGRQAVLNVWERPINSCVQILDCGNDHFVFRQKFLDNQTLEVGETSEEFLLGYNEWANSSNSYYFSSLQEKDVDAFGGYGYDLTSNSNEFVDYSYAGYATNYAAKAMRRNRFYNPLMALYEKGGSLVYGSSPDWFSESSCKEVSPTTVKKLDYTKVRTDTPQNFCNDDDYINLSAGEDVIYEGEDYFSRLDVPSDYKINFSLGDGSYGWFEIGSPADYWDDYKDVVNNNVSGYRDIVYIRSRHNQVRQVNTLDPETIVYSLDAEDSYGHKTSAQRTIVIKDGKDHPESKKLQRGLAVLLGDETWFKKYQLDIATGIVNYSDQDITLENFYYDYYGQVDVRDPSHDINQPNFWYPKLGEEADKLHIEETYTDCGNNRFRVRYKYKGKKILYSNQSFFDNKVGFYYGTTKTYNKTDDYSMQDFKNDRLNRRRYAPHVPLYDGRGELLWGNAPTWAKDCVDAANENSGFEDELLTESSSSAVSTPVFESSSSAQEKGDKLVVRFADASAYTDSRLDIKMDIVNNGSTSVDLSGYEIRFYYGKTSLLDDIDLLNKSATNSSGVTIEDRRCAEDLYMLSAKFNSKTMLAAGEKSNPIEYVMKKLNGDEWIGLPFGKKEFASYLESSALVVDHNIALYDKNGKLVFGIPAWECEGYEKKELKLSVLETLSLVKNEKKKGMVGSISLTIKNDGDSAVAGPAYVDYQVTHSLGQIPILAIGKDTLAVANTMMDVSDGLHVIRLSSGNKHVFRFIIVAGIPQGKYSRNIDFTLFDQCLFDCTSETEDQSLIDAWSKQYSWNFVDDWSAKDVISYEGTTIKYPKKKVTKNVAIYNSALALIYGSVDSSSPILASPVIEGETEVSLKHSFTENKKQKTNRTDAVSYAGGQLISGGDFETAWLQGWNVSDNVSSIRGDAPQGSRYVQLNAGSQISQKFSPVVKQTLIDSGATIIVWHKGAYTHFYLNEQNFYLQALPYSASWRLDTIYIEPNYWKNVDSLCIRANGNLSLDDMVMIPGNKSFPSIYAVRFTTTQHDEVETRSFDGDKELLVTNAVRDELGRSWKKYLPFALPCSSVLECNSETKTLKYPEMANQFYVDGNEDYPDAGKYAYVETKWKPDQVATKNIESAPGAAFSLTKEHVIRSYSSGVNLNIDKLKDFDSLAESVKAVQNEVLFDEGNGLLKKNYHANHDENPTYVWSLIVDQNNNASFSVVDGDGHTIVSGAMKYDSSSNTYNMISRSVYELDSRGNVIKSHSPLSCEYNPIPSNCVSPNKYEYDDESRVISSVEPDAGTTRSYYDVAGRLRATQTQNQIDRGVASVIVYDDFDRQIFTGEWNVPSDFGKDYFKEQKNWEKAGESDLIPGTVTRMIYDEMPKNISLGVTLYPADIDFDETFKYSKGRLVAAISDVYVTKNTYGADYVVRTAMSISYDKYGRILATYTYDPTMPADSLRMMAVKNIYDIGGKLVETMKYPFGLSNRGKVRMVSELYSYDRLGRVSHISVKNGESLATSLVNYTYYPTGNVKSVRLGNSVTIDYSYHISGAIKSASVKRADGMELYKEELFYEDCGNNSCKPQYNGNVSRMVHQLSSYSRYPERRNSNYYYDLMNRLTKVSDAEEAMFNEVIAYDEQGRIVSMRRAKHAENATGGEYSYKQGKNQLASVAAGIGGGNFKFLSDISADVTRNMSDSENFVYDAEGNLIEDKSKNLKIFYDWRGMPVEFRMETRADDGSQPTRSCSRGDSLMLTMAYDGSGRRVSKTRFRKACISDEADGVYAADWERELVTHYTGIGTEVRESFHNGTPSETKVVVNMPQGLGRYGVEDAANSDIGFGAGYIPSTKFEWYLKNHLGSTMLVYGTQGSSNTDIADLGEVKKAYDYRSFGEQIDLIADAGDKVTENFTGKEKDDETELNYFGARYLDPMLGMWISVDPARQLSSPYLYVGNGMNPVNGVDEDGNVFNEYGNQLFAYMQSTNFNGSETLKRNMTRAHDDPKRYFNINPKRIAKIEPSARNKEGFEKTYDVFFPVDMNEDGTDLSIMTYILAGHELNHPYTTPKPGHNYTENVKTKSEYFEKLQQKANEPEPDKIYLDDYNSAKEMGVYDE
ncbi:RHS repeat-associated core domain-containing protein [Fibrobacter sp. UWH9]|uniref:RHS repeat domain-containing protein n=1 Tax=Fibrobacter sp. UWH9 TaxID=1896213 RepID=UPI000919F006|nr:RHS repeat-associated core domain-containing protein [Fibrobacter sp. UWH9]SHH87874.1 RHS repeat-associated core domain-containing protein [Fibrobacter sp. UWH9]